MTDNIQLIEDGLINLTFFQDYLKKIDLTFTNEDAYFSDTEIITYDKECSLFFDGNKRLLDNEESKLIIEKINNFVNYYQNEINIAKKIIN